MKNNRFSLAIDEFRELATRLLSASYIIVVYVVRRWSFHS